MLPKGVEANETGHATMLDRVKAFRRLINEIGEFTNHDELTEASNRFVVEWWDRLNGLSDEELEDVTVSAKQYFWAKDLYDKHVVGA